MLLVINNKMSSITKVKYSNEPVFVNSDGTLEPYIPRDIVTHRDAYSTSLHMLFKHVGDFHILLVDILSEKTGMDSLEIMKVVQEDSRYKDMMVTPTLHALGVIEKADVEKKVTVDEVDGLTGKMNTLEVEEAPQKKRKYIRKAKV